MSRGPRMSTTPVLIGTKEAPVPAVRWRSWHPFDRAFTGDELRELINELTAALEKAEAMVPAPPKRESWWRRWRNREASS